MPLQKSYKPFGSRQTHAVLGLFGPANKPGDFLEFENWFKITSYELMDYIDLISGCLFII